MRAHGAHAGWLSTLGAWVFSRIEKESMNDVSLIVFSVLGGAVTGMYMLGFFTRRVDGFAVNVALGCFGPMYSSPYDADA